MENNQRGFIQLPILAIIAIFAAISTAGYFGIEKYIDYQIKQTEKDKQVQEQQKALEQVQQELESLKSNKQVPIGTPSPKKSVPSPVSMEPKNESPIPIVPNTQQTNSCINIRQEYDDFEKKYEEVGNKILDVKKIYVEANSSSSAGLSGVSAFKYLYSQATARKDLFFQNLTELKDLVLKLPNLSKDQNSFISLLKSNYQKGISAYTYAYNLNLEVYKNISESLSYSTIESSESSLASANESRKSGDFYFQSGASTLTGGGIFITFKQIYNNSLIKNGCKSFCSDGYMLSQDKCVVVKPSSLIVPQINGTPETIFAIRGGDFGDVRSTSNVLVSDKQADIILWSHTEIQFKVPSNVNSGSNSVVLKILSGETFLTINLGNININR